MTKHTTIDDGLPKYQIPLEEASKLIESNIKIISSSSSMDTCGIRVKTINTVGSKLAHAKPRENRVRVTTLKQRLAKVMHRLYDLEPENVSEKTLNADLGVNLYQMEDY